MKLCVSSWMVLSFALNTASGRYESATSNSEAQKQCCQVFFFSEIEVLDNLNKVDSNSLRLFNDLCTALLKMMASTDV